MSPVGTFPGTTFGQRRAVRAEPNPLDKSTIISIYPRKIDEIHHTIQPRRFVIEPGNFSNPAILVVGSASWWREIDEKQPLLEIPNYSTQVADAIVKCYCSGLLGYNQENMPGMFWVPGEKTKKDLKTDPVLINLLAKAKIKQDAYWQSLIKLADGLWSRTNGSPLCISEDMRMAARELGATKDWMSNFALTDNVKCVACGQPRNPSFPICPNCKTVIDKDKAKEMGLVFAQ